MMMMMIIIVVIVTMMSQNSLNIAIRVKKLVDDLLVEFSQ